MARSLGIPSRIHHKDIINYKAIPIIANNMKSNKFIYSGHVEFLLDGKWVVAIPAFDKHLSKERNYPLVEFDGFNDAELAPTDSKGNKFVEYIADRGFFADPPYEQIVSDIIKIYYPEWAADIDTIMKAVYTSS